MADRPTPQRSPREKPWTSAHAVIPGVALTLRRHQRVPLAPQPVDHVFVVISGVILLEAQLQDRPRTVLEILFHDDILHAQEAPESLGAALVAATPAELQRFRPGVLETLERDNPEFTRRIAAAILRRSARRTLHLTSVSGHSGEQRLADFLVELGLFLGRPVRGGRLFELPMTREEIARYLALNPDTLSRHVSRLRSSGVIAISRGQATVPDWQALVRLSPLAPALTALASATDATG